MCVTKVLCGLTLDWVSYTVMADSKVGVHGGNDVIGEVIDD